MIIRVTLLEQAVVLSIDRGLSLFQIPVGLKKPFKMGFGLLKTLKKAILIHYSHGTYRVYQRVNHYDQSVS
jgi:hypothetical protein